MRAGGKITKLMAREDLSTLMVMFMMDNGLMIRLMDSVSTVISTEQNMKVTGKKTSNTEKDLKHGQMELNMKECTFKERRMAKVNSLGLTDQPIMENLLKIILKEEESIIGLTVENTMDNGKITKWKEEAFSHGQMVEDMRVITSMTRKRVMVFSTGQMEENTKEVGKMESSMELVLTPQLVAKRNKECGLKAKDSIGSQTTTNEIFESKEIVFSI